MISVSQIRAARALLGWKQSELAIASGISVPAIARLEQNNGNPRAGTMEAIQKAFEKAGIEFFGESGLDLRKEVFKIDILDGVDAMQKLWDDIVATLTDVRGAELLMSGINERTWFDYFGDRVSSEMKRRFDMRIQQRILIKEGDNLCLGSEESYRCVPDAVFGQTPYFIYADRYALINWTPMRIILIRSPSIASTFRKQFDFNWSTGTPVINPKVLNPFQG